MYNVDCTKLGHDISLISSSIKYNYFYKVLSNNLAELKYKKSICKYERSLDYDSIHSGLPFPGYNVFLLNNACIGIIKSSEVKKFCRIRAVPD